MRHIHLSTLLATAAVLAPGAAAAQSSDSLSEIVVTATRRPTPLNQVGSAITVVTAEEIESSQRTQVLDVLARTPGVSISRTGGLGASSAVRIRGSDTGQVKVLIDGVEVNDPSGAGNDFDFSAMTTAGIERIEVLRGPQSALYGNDAMGGVINIITKQADGPVRVNGLAEYGAFDTRRIQGTVAGRVGTVSGSFNAAWVKSDGFSRVAAGGENDGAEALNLSGRLGTVIADTVRLNLSGGYEDMDSDFDPSTSQDGPASQKKKVLHGSASAGFDLLDGRWSHTLTLSGSDTDRDFDEPLGYYRYSTYDGSRTGLDYQTELKLRSADVLTAGASREWEKAKNTSTISGVKTTGTDAEVHTDAVFAQYQLAVTDAVFITGGVRHDDNSRFGGKTTGRIAASWSLPTGTRLRASYGTAAKAPSLYQLFDPDYGNRDLKTETSKGIDAGVVQSFLDGRIELEAGVFHTDYDNLIAFTSGYVNIAKAKTKGVELAATLRPLDWLDLSGNYTLLDTEDPATNRALPRRPRHTVNLSAAVRPLAGTEIGTDLRYVSRQRDRASASAPILDSYTVVDLRVSQQVTDAVSVFGRVENLFDENYQEVYGYRTSGTAAYVGVRGAF
ncbi:TonB-dependent receptor plug domain-containing protein [Oleisolibacter albus]|uniref:TonB-dependent receptor plug domain-containing protein n=1 Tax=Oleisolibacter albus TaxID=2171757 RepID=UPI00138FDF6E|nr:TonB-dependent receptor [Oleisolibacter albus]